MIDFRKWIGLQEKEIELPLFGKRALINAQADKTVKFVDELDHATRWEFDNKDKQKILRAALRIIRKRR